MYGHALLRCLRLPLRTRAEFCLSPSYFTPSVASRTKPSGIFLRILDCRGYGSWNHTLSCGRQSLLARMGGTTGNTSFFSHTNRVLASFVHPSFHLKLYLCIHQSDSSTEIPFRINILGLSSESTHYTIELLPFT